LAIIQESTKQQPMKSGAGQYCPLYQLAAFLRYKALAAQV
jgi:hypothetical protein